MLQLVVLWQLLKKLRPESNRYIFHQCAFVCLFEDKKVDVEGIGNIKFDIAYGGAYYAFVHHKELKLGIEMKMTNHSKFIKLWET